MIIGYVVAVCRFLVCGAKKMRYVRRMYVNMYELLTVVPTVHTYTVVPYVQTGGGERDVGVGVEKIKDRWLRLRLNVECIHKSGTCPSPSPLGAVKDETSADHMGANTALLLQLLCICYTAFVYTSETAFGLGTCRSQIY